MFDFESEATKNIMQIKSNVQSGQMITMETFDMLLSLYLGQVKTTKELERQLNYALETGGKYLELNTVVQWKYNFMGGLYG